MTSRAAPALGVDEEARLLEQIRSGPRAERDTAYERLFSAVREPVLALCMQITGSPADAEDAMQNALLAAYRGLVGFRGQARFLTWVCRIAVREALRVKGRGRSDQSLEQEPAAPDAGDPAVRSERAAQFRRAFDQLPADHRAVLSLFAIEGLSHREIAKVLKVPEGTIWSRLHKARKRLAHEMSQPGLDASRSDPSAPPTPKRASPPGRGRHNAPERPLRRALARAAFRLRRMLSPAFAPCAAVAAPRPSTQA